MPLKVKLKASRPSVRGSFSFFYLPFSLRIPKSHRFFYSEHYKLNFVIAQLYLKTEPLQFQVTRNLYTVRGKSLRSALRKTIVPSVSSFSRGREILGKTLIH